MSAAIGLDLLIISRQTSKGADQHTQCDTYTVPPKWRSLQAVCRWSSDPVKRQQQLTRHNAIAYYTHQQKGNRPTQVYWCKLNKDNVNDNDEYSFIQSPDKSR